MGNAPVDPPVCATADRRTGENRTGLAHAPIDPDSATGGLSFRSNFIWIFAGNVTYALCQWGLIVALAKLGSTSMVGEFSLGLAIATPIFMFSNLQLRAVQATDARRSYGFREYLHLRIFTTVAALGMIISIVAMGEYKRGTALTIVAVALIKAIDTLSDIHYGLFQQHDRLNEAGVSMILRGALSLIVLSTGIYFTHQLLWGCLGVTIAWIATLFLFDARRAAVILRRSRDGAKSRLQTIRNGMRWRTHAALRYWPLARLAFPLGIVTTLAALNLNIPRYFIHARMGDHHLGIFSALAYTTVAITLVTDSLGHSGIPKMSRLYADRRFTEFSSVLSRLVVSGIILGLVALAVAHLAGPQLLTVLYGKEYASQSGVFTLLILAAGINCIASALATGITSARRFGIQVPLFGLVIAVSIFTCVRSVPDSGLFGGALAMVYSALMRLLLSIAVIVYLLSGISKDQHLLRQDTL